MVLVNDLITWVVRDSISGRCRRFSRAKPCHQDAEDESHEKSNDGREDGGEGKGLLTIAGNRLEHFWPEIIDFFQDNINILEGGICFVRLDEQILIVNQVQLFFLSLDNSQTVPDFVIFNCKSKNKNS